jgi:hypothetical protein
VKLRKKVWGAFKAVIIKFFGNLKGWKQRGSSARISQGPTSCD